MKIAFLGTKGIPNNYGGFEQFAEYLSVRLAQKGHEVTVYNPSYHPHKDETFKGVRIRRINSQEKWMGGAANMLYDYLCLKHALKQDYDVIYEAGYHSVAMAYKFLGVKKYRKPVVITNMDGLEWKRSKWSPRVQRFIRRLEAMAVEHSPYLLSDNPGIQQYYLDHFKRESFCLPYGADPVYEYDKSCLDKYRAVPGNYFVLIARMEPENNIEMVLHAYVESASAVPFIVFGDYTNRFGLAMYKRFSGRVQFAGSCYDKRALDSVRHFSKAYFHGHSVGGTNPSLLEAMSSRSFIISHDNPFNRGVLESEGVYFSTLEELKGHFIAMEQLVAEKSEIFKEKNFEKIVSQYNWDAITSRHEALFASLLKR